MKTPLAARRRAFVDVETTGLDPATHEIIEFAVVFDDGQFESFKVLPRHPETADPAALAVNGWTPEEWKHDALGQRTAAARIFHLLQDAIVVGFNVGFDASFIRAMLRREGFNANEICRHCGDPVTLALEHLVPKGLDSLSLKNVMTFLGMEPEPDIHRALAGARGCKSVWDALVAKDPADDPDWYVKWSKSSGFVVATRPYLEKVWGVEGADSVVFQSEEAAVAKCAELNQEFGEGTPWKMFKVVVTIEKAGCR